MSKVSTSKINTGVVMLNQMIRIRVSNCWNKIKISCILKRQEEQANIKPRHPISRKGDLYCSIAKLCISLDKKKKLAFLKLKLNKMKREDNKALTDCSLKGNRYERYNDNSRGLTISKNPSCYSLRDQSSFIFNMPRTGLKKVSSLIGFKRVDRTILPTILKIKIDEMRRLAFERLKSLMQMEVIKMKSETGRYIIMPSQNPNSIQQFGTGSIIIDVHEKSINTSSLFSAIPVKQSSGYFSINSLNNSLIDNSKDLSFGNKPMRYLKGLELLKRQETTRKKETLE